MCTYLIARRTIDFTTVELKVNGIVRGAELVLMKRIQNISLLMLVTVSLTGCASLQSGQDGFGTGLRHKCMAQQAWNEWSWCYDELDHPRHFAKGFKAGYRDVIQGGNGCQPTLPPKCYWKSCYQSAEGRCKVNSWFDGFSHGALAAQQDGVGDWTQIPISPTARMNLQMSSAQPQSFGWNGQGTPPPMAGPAPPPIAGSVPPVLPPTGAGTGGDLRPDDGMDNSDTLPEDQALPLRPYE
jgi:hypothetical protein